MDKFWHKLLRRPYLLSKTMDTGAGTTIVFLHGIGRTGRVWQHVVELLAPHPFRLVAFDLLGFGDSPKPDWPKYDVDDHARSVIASIKSIRAGGPVILVGHSMGCLVAVRAARRRPDLVRHLVLFEMPLYEGLPQKRRYRLQTDLYFRVYRRIMAYQPNFDQNNLRLAERLARRIIGFEVTAETWQPFIKSLKNTIMNQTAADDIQHLEMPMDVIYGSFDMLVIRGKPQDFFGDQKDNITAHTVRARHDISPAASHFIVERIDAAMHEHPD